jgi:hypothetical protein
MLDFLFGKKKKLPKRDYTRDYHIEDLSTFRELWTAPWVIVTYEGKYYLHVDTLCTDTQGGTAQTRLSYVHEQIVVSGLIDPHPYDDYSLSYKRISFDPRNYVEVQIAERAL